MNGNTDTGLGSDLLRGADSIAEFLYGAPGGRRKVYYLAAHSRLPVFRLGSVLCARRSVLLQWIEAQERKVAAGMVNSRSRGPRRAAG